jgi:predicted class III extradiol MEMO1 family dioxygenase
MAMDLKTVEGLIREIELADPIDWGMLNISEDDATRLIASSVVEHYEENIRPMSERERDYIVVSSIAKLTLENFVLNVKLARATGGQA